MRPNEQDRVLVFAGRTTPSDLLAERTLLARLENDHFGMLMTRDSSSRSAPDLVAAVQRLVALPGFGGEQLVFVEASAVPMLDPAYVLRMAEHRLNAHAAGRPASLHRLVIHEEALDDLTAPRVTDAHC
jgi:hypothetical protein